MPRLKNFLNKIIAERGIGILSVFLFLITWEALGRFKIVDPLFIGLPSGALAELGSLFKEGELWTYLLNSLLVFFVSFALAIVAGVALGLAVGVNRTAYRWLSPYIYGLDAIPKVVIIPLVIIWFGIRLKAEGFVVFLMAVIPVLISTIDGVRNIDKSLVRMAVSFKAGSWLKLREIYFYGCLPQVFSGLRISRSKAITGLVVAEFAGLGHGLGYLISFYGATFQTNRMIALVVILMVVNALVLKAIDLGEKKLVTWK